MYITRQMDTTRRNRLTVDNVEHREECRYREPRRQSNRTDARQMIGQMFWAP